jgi:hypothetical protein
MTSSCADVACAAFGPTVLHDPGCDSPLPRAVPDRELLGPAMAFPVSYPRYQPPKIAGTESDSCWIA